jgi:hypothetical protein
MQIYYSSYANKILCICKWNDVLTQMNHSTKAKRKMKINEILCIYETEIKKMRGFGILNRYYRLYRLNKEHIPATAGFRLSLKAKEKKSKSIRSARFAHPRASDEAPS